MKITHIFFDIGGVLLTNGWDHDSRKKAAEHFKLDWAELEHAHHLLFETWEIGKLTFEEYLQKAVFYKKRPFTKAAFQEFMFGESKPFPKMLALARRLKKKHKLKLVAVNNEAAELNLHRIRKFQLTESIDTFISSCYVHLRKPDREIYRLAMQIAQAEAEEIIYIENTPLFIQIAQELGIKGILHKNYEETEARLVQLLG
jgi:putative hydrolase of the HAD superfamily